KPAFIHPNPSRIRPSVAQSLRISIPRFNSSPLHPGPRPSMVLNCWMTSSTPCGVSSSYRPGPRRPRPSVFEYVRFGGFPRVADTLRPLARKAVWQDAQSRSAQLHGPPLGSSGSTTNHLAIGVEAAAESDRSEFEMSGEGVNEIAGQISTPDLTVTIADH